ncbi:heparinase II/III domain-containing protein [Carboxylicivirga sp. N1Y90]|uniref:heparinase II/III domain-containing protein n=1 Tax=Carboxylicivirga fragile TaxID=3417571 RepID=UPI003D353BB0
MYWFLNQKQLQGLNSIDTKKPEYGSLFFPYTHYYIMREGWSAEDKMMITSAGLDKDKPDHQHGDMLGIQAIAYGKTILPNYQVRYSLKDYDLFKNSLVKNVALVDNELQGKQWTSNKGGSGFGKFKSLPQPNVITWESNDDFDLFVGTHDGFENVGVKYSRQVVYVKDEFWIVKDNFNSESSHTYKQVWQGHYTSENGADLLRSSFDDATGCDIFQLIDADEVTSSGARGKQWNIVSKADQKNYSFLTIIYPYKGYGNRIDESKNYKIKGWEVNTMPFKADGEQVRSLSNEDAHYVFNVRQLTIEGAEIKFSDQVDICLIRQELGWELHLLSDTVIEIERASKSISLKPGEKYKIK